MNLFKTLAMVGLVLASTCQTSIGADTCSKTNLTNKSVVEVKCQLLTVPIKVLKKTENDLLRNEPFPPGVCAQDGIFQKDQLDVLWKSLMGQTEVIIEEIGDIAVKSGASGKIQKGYDFSYPVDYDNTGKPIKMRTDFLGTKIEVKSVVLDMTIDLHLNLENNSLKGLAQIYSIQEANLLRKPTFEELVATLPKRPIFDPIIRHRSCESNVTLYTGQTIFYAMDDYDNSDFLEKIPHPQIKLKDPSKRRYLIITAKIINSPSKTP